MGATERLLCAALGLYAISSTAAGVQAQTQERPWTVSSDSLLYTDTDNVLVVTSQLGASRALDDDGGQASASAVVDVVSAASVDVVSQASHRFDEVRGEVNLAASHAFEFGLPALNYRGSVEPDYVSHGAGAGYQTRLGGADSVLAAHYQLTLDTVGRSGTPFTTFSRALTTHAAELGLTQNLGRKTVLRVVYSFTWQDGYMEKPYRFVPLFDAAGLARARSDGAALDLDSFDRYRLAARPPEEVPDLRLRHALGLRALQYIAPLDGSIRADYRLYLDDWGVLAHTGELALELPLSSLLTLGVFGRGYTQSAASFYRAVYVTPRPDELPQWRTVDRKLSPYDALTGGARIELHTDAITAYFEASSSFTRFRDYIYLDHVIALIGQGGISWAF